MITPEAGKMLRMLQKYVVLPEYQRGFESWPDGRPKTYCNIYGTKMGILLGYDMKPFLKEHSLDNIMNSVLGDMYDQAISDGVKQLAKPNEAQSLANVGHFIIGWSKKYDHVVVVCPDLEEYNAKRGPRIIQAGWYNGEFYMSDPASFGSNWNDPEIKYFAPRSLV